MRIVTRRDQMSELIDEGRLSAGARVFVKQRYIRCAIRQGDQLQCNIFSRFNISNLFSLKLHVGVGEEYAI